MKKQDVVIIGAGPAGLTAAYELLQRSDNYNVTILEESDMVGGISRTVVHHGNRMDLGGHRFFSKSQRVNDWWDALMPHQGSPSLDDRLLNREVPLTPNGPDPEAEDCVMLTRRRVSRIYYKKKFFDYPVRINRNTLVSMGFSTTMKAGFSYLHTLLHKQPEDSLENFYINRFGKQLYSMFFEGYTEKLWGRHPSCISADWGAQRVKGLSVLAVIKDVLQKIGGRKSSAQTETSLIEEFSYPKFGPGQLWQTAAEKIVAMGGSIRFGVRAQGIKFTGNRIVSVAVTENGASFDLPADFVISSMPLKELVAGMQPLHGAAPVPDDVSRIAAGLPYRDFVTVGLLLNKLNLKNTTTLKTLGNIIPDCWIYVQDTGVKLGRIQIFNNWSPYLVQNPDKQVWVGLEYFCNEDDRFWRMSKEEWIAMGTAELIAMGVISSEDDVLDAHQERVKKAYPAYFDTYPELHTVIDYLSGFDNLYCIGRNGQHRYNNMDHSMETAFAAVDCILTGSDDKSAVWNVNTEKSYHEEKKPVSDASAKSI